MFAINPVHWRCHRRSTTSFEMNNIVFFYELLYTARGLSVHEALLFCQGCDLTGVYNCIDLINCACIYCHYWISLKQINPYQTSLYDTLNPLDGICIYERSWPSYFKAISHVPHKTRPMKIMNINVRKKKEQNPSQLLQTLSINHTINIFKSSHKTAVGI